MGMLKDAKDFYNIDASTFKRFIKLLDGIENGQLPSVAGLEILISDFTEENPTDSADIFLKKKKILLFCELLKISSNGVKIQDFVKLTPGQKKFAGKAITDVLGQGSICFVHSELVAGGRPVKIAELTILRLPLSKNFEPFSRKD